MVENVLIIEKGLWAPRNIIIHKIAERSDIRLYPGDFEAIEERWKEVLAKNKKAFIGPTVRFVGSHRIGEDLIIEIIPSDYKEGCTLGWLGAAMVPITTDGYVGLQCHVDSISATIGKGVRVPGCTIEDTEETYHIIKEMKEEFNVEITTDDITIHGLIEVRPPVSLLNHALIAKINLSLNYRELKKSWETADDKTEGKLTFCKLDYSRKKISFKEIGGKKMLNPQSLVILEMISESEFGTKKGGEKIGRNL